MSRQFTDQLPILTAKASTGAGTAQLVSDFRDLVVSLDTTSSANMTIKFVGSIQDSEPTWTSAQSATNQWDYLEIIDLEDGSSIDGDVGIVLTGTDDHRQFEINVNGVKWLNAVVTARSAGSATVKGVFYGNNI